MRKLIIPTSPVAKPAVGSTVVERSIECVVSMYAGAIVRVKELDLVREETYAVTKKVRGDEYAAKVVAAQERINKAYGLTV